MYSLLHYKINVEVILEIFVQFDNIGVVKGLQDTDLGTETFEVLNLCPRYCLYCALLPRDFVPAHLNYPIRATAKFLKSKSYNEIAIPLFLFNRLSECHLCCEGSLYSYVL